MGGRRIPRIRVRNSGRATPSLRSGLGALIECPFHNQLLPGGSPTKEEEAIPLPISSDGVDKISGQGTESGGERGILLFQAWKEFTAGARSMEDGEPLPLSMPCMGVELS